MDYVKIDKTIFYGRQHIDWESVKEYMREFQGSSYRVKETSDLININYTSIDEYTSSKYTRGLRGGLAKTKANLSQGLPEIIAHCTNRRWQENRSEKHQNMASRGWYRYNTFFAIMVHGDQEDHPRWNYYKGTMLVAINDTGLYLYDIINIKKEARNLR